MMLNTNTCRQQSFVLQLCFCVGLIFVMFGTSAVRTSKEPTRNPHEVFNNFLLFDTKPLKQYSEPSKVEKH